MLARLRPHGPALLGAVLCAAVAAWLGLVDFGWNDYAFEAAPAFEALARGDVGGFLAQAPAYGGSLVLRAPLALAPGLWGGGDLAIYRAVSLPGLAAMGILAVWLVARMRDQGQPLLNRATALALCAAGPVAVRAMDIGHPEELMGAALCVGALLAGLRGHALWAGLLLGLAVATKAWALVAVAPVLLAVPAPRWRAALLAAGMVAAVMAPLAIGDGSRLEAATRGMAHTGEIFQPASVWWFAGETGHVVRGSDGMVKEGFRLAPEWLRGVTHPLIVLVGFALGPLWWLRRRGAQGEPHDLLLLLALALHLRCLLDTWNTDYYAVPALTALLVWESLARRRAPLLTLALTLLNWWTFQSLPPSFGPDAQSLVYLAWAVPLAVALGVRVFAPVAWRRLVVWPGAPRVVPDMRPA